MHGTPSASHPKVVGRLLAHTAKTVLVDQADDMSKSLTNLSALSVFRGFTMSWQR